MWRQLGGVVFFVLGAVSWASAETEVDLGRIQVTASRMDRFDYKVASDVSVIDREMIEESSAQTVAEILQEQPAVAIYDTGSPKTAVVDLRGFGDTAGRNVLVLVNDRKVNSIDISGPDLLQIPLDMVDRIEIVRGAGSVLYGDNAVGGVVNIITRRGRGRFSGRVGGRFGSYDSGGPQMEVSGDHRGLSYYFFSQYFDDGGYRANSDVLSKDFNGRLGYRFTDRVRLDLTTSWHEDDYGLPGGLNASELEDLGRRGSADPDDFAATKDRHVQLSLDVYPWPEDKEWGHLVTTASFRNRDTYAEFAAFDFGTKRAIDTLGLTIKYAFDHRVLGRELSFVTGLDFYDVENDILGSGSNTDDLRISKEEVGGYLFFEYEALPRTFVNAGTRFQEASYTFDQKGPGRDYQTESPHASVNLVGARYEYGRGSSLFLNVQQTFRFLATDEWYDTFNGLNTGLDQQRGIQYEGGIKHRFGGGGMVTVTPYWMDLREEIYFDPQGGAFGFGANSNYDKTRRTGVEFSGRIDATRWWDDLPLDRCELWASYTYQRPRFVDGPSDGKWIPMAARHQARAGVSLGRGRWLATLEGRYVGTRYAINDVLNAVPPIKPHVTMGAKVVWEAAPLKMFVAVDNLLGERYFSYVSKSTTSDARDFYPAPERRWTAGVDLRF